MLYHLLYPLHTDFSVFYVFRFITFRAIYATITALMLSFLLRYKSLDTNLYFELLDLAEIGESELVHLAFQAFKFSPKLLEWSIIWSDMILQHARN